MLDIIDGTLLWRTTSLAVIPPPVAPPSAGSSRWQVPVEPEVMRIIDRRRRRILDDEEMAIIE